MFCMKSIVLFFLLNGLEMPSSAKVIYKGMPRVEFPEIFEPIKKMDYPIDNDENKGMMSRVEFPERFIKRVMDYPQNINKNKESRSGSEDYSKDKFAESFLAEHNKLRAKHGVPLLKLTDQLNKTAQDWAEKLIKENSFNHSPKNSRGGESLHRFTSNPKNSRGGEGIPRFTSNPKNSRGGESIHRFTSNPKNSRVGESIPRFTSNPPKRPDPKVIVQDWYSV